MNDTTDTTDTTDTLRAVIEQYSAAPSDAFNTLLNERLQVKQDRVKEAILDRSIEILDNILCTIDYTALSDYEKVDQCIKLMTAISKFKGGN